MHGVHYRITNTLARLGRYGRDRIAIDTRTLAAFRVVAGVLILADLFARSKRFTEFYTDVGMVPQEVVNEIERDYRFSFFLMSSDPLVTASLFVVHALIAIQLIIGYKARAAVILSFLFVISLDNRNPLILSYADVLFRLLLFWAMFLPLGERWSIDAVHRGREPRTHVANLASAAILVQMFYMYFGNAIHKLGDDNWRSGDATPMIFGLDSVTWGIAPYLREFPILLSIGGWIWLLMLVYCSWLAILSSGRVRTLVVAAFLVVHLSFALTVRIGAFPYVAMCGVILFLQAPFWNDLWRVTPAIALDQLNAVRVRLVFLAKRVPRLDPGLPVSQRAINAGYHAFVTLAVLGVLVLPPLTFLQGTALISTDLKRIERPMTTLTSSIAVSQMAWGIFASTDPLLDKYFVFAAVSEEGTEYDVYFDRPLSYERPYDDLQQQFTHYRERFYMAAIDMHEASDAARDALGTYLCDRWERERGIVLTQIDMYVVREQVTMDTISDHAQRERSTQLLYQHGCDGEASSEISPPEF